MNPLLFILCVLSLVSCASHRAVSPANDDDSSPLNPTQGRPFLHQLFRSGQQLKHTRVQEPALSKELVANNFSKTQSSSYFSNTDAQVISAQVPLQSNTIDSKSAQNNSNRNLSYTASLSLEVDSLQKASDSLRSLMSSFDAYLADSRYSVYTFKVPASTLDNVIQSLSRLGIVHDKVLHAHDLSDEFADYELRLSNAENARKRYLELLAKAETVEAGLKVEKELERLSNDIENFKAQLEKFKQSVALSTITISLYCKTKENQASPGPLGYVFVGLYEGVKWLFVWD